MRRLFQRVRTVIASMLVVCAGPVGYFLGEPFWDAMTRDPGQALLPASGASVSDAKGIPYLPLDPGAASISVTFDQIPATFVDALLAAEDKRFFHHPGVDPIALARAFVSGVRRGLDFGQGGSTLTTQLVKNTYGRRSSGRLANFQRKIFENALSPRVEWTSFRRHGNLRAGKEAIFAAYCNRVSFGGASTGLQEAVRYYFPGKQLDHLTVGECALLAGTVRGPGANDPHVSLENARAARDRVLSLMAKNGFVREGEKGEFLVSSRPGRPEATGDGFTRDLIRNEVRRLVEAGQLPSGIESSDGVEVVLTLDLRFQDACARILRSELDRIESLPGFRAHKGSLQGALVVLDHNSGAALAIVGGRDHSRMEFNLALGGRRHPASTVKPLVYAAYLDRYPPPESLLLSNAPLSPAEAAGLAGVHAPRETSRLRAGVHSLAEGIAHSSNRMVLRAGRRLGWDRWLATAISLGWVGVDYPRSTDVWLGAHPSSPWQMAAAYASLARRGERIEPRIIASVRRHEAGETKPLYVAPSHPTRLFQTASCDAVHKGLAAVLTEGTASGPGAAFAAETGAVGKTGTSGSVADAWFAGYTDTLAIAVWIGFAEGNRPILSQGTGATMAFPVFARVVESAPADRPARIDWSR